MQTAATATFADSYCGKVTVRLERHGKGWLWVGGMGINPGYRPISTASRAIAIARQDRRFSSIDHQVPLPE